MSVCVEVRTDRSNLSVSPALSHPALCCGVKIRLFFFFSTTFLYVCCRCHVSILVSEKPVSTLTCEPQQEKRWHSYRMEIWRGFNTCVWTESAGSPQGSLLGAVRWSSYSLRLTILENALMDAPYSTAYGVWNNHNLANQHWFKEFWKILLSILLVSIKFINFTKIIHQSESLDFDHPITSQVDFSLQNITKKVINTVCKITAASIYSFLILGSRRERIVAVKVLICFVKANCSWRAASFISS